MIKRLAEIVQGFAYEDILFIIGGGLTISALTIGLAFFLTRGKKSKG